MKEQHVVSLELAKELKEVGYPQEGEFWWVEFGKDLEFSEITAHKRAYNYEPPTRLTNAPLASEIMEKLPETIKDSQRYSVMIDKYKKGYGVNYSFMSFHHQGDTLVDALAKMYIYLAKNNLLGGSNDQD